LASDEERHFKIVMQVEVLTILPCYTSIIPSQEEIADNGKIIREHQVNGQINIGFQYIQNVMYFQRLKNLS